MAQVTIIVGSPTDRPVIDPALEILRNFKIEFELKVSSAHRDPERTASIVKEAEEKGTRVFIAAAGMAAHLAGLVAAHTTRPVIGIPVSSGPLKGQDSLLSTMMMPAGVPVATVAVDGGKNAAWLAIEILALIPEFAHLQKELASERIRMREQLKDAEKKWVEELKK